MTTRIERSGKLPPDVGALVSDSERAGLEFVRRLVEDWASGANRFDRPGEAFFIARLDGSLVGVCGLNVDPYAADPRVGRVRHLYVLSDRRTLGIGRRLVEDIIAAARGPFGRLRLRTNNPSAARLYERVGFRRSPELADATHVMELG
jgi:GNAT superfamily N-acetyltransferase